jgi:mannose-6-phosphate isomerase-like protein (cupin superfamily)
MSEEPTAAGSAGDDASAPPYTLMKLTDAEDMAVKHGFSETGEARFPTGDLALEQAGLSHHRVAPNARQAFGHRHDEAEEVYVVIGGAGRVKLDDEIVDVGPLDALRVAPPVIRSFEAGPEGLEYLAFGARHDGDGELIPGWWSD